MDKPLAAVDAGGSDREVNRDDAVDSSGRLFVELDTVATALELEKVVSTVGKDPISTVEDGKMLNDGIVLLSIRVNDRDMEVEVDPAEVDMSLVLEATPVEDEAEIVSDVINELRC